ncbi:MAG: TIGR02452 family protein [Synergistaceae bacterium]|nr:TIGR02452 family protein [Synergistaceae bacterium]
MPPHVFRDIKTSEEELFSIHVKRAKNILRVAAYNGADILVTGAFGCGAFHNPPEVVARAWREALEEYREKFDLIDFVIYVSDFPAKRVGGEKNLQAFRNEFTD